MRVRLQVRAGVRAGVRTCTSIYACITIKLYNNICVRRACVRSWAHAHVRVSTYEHSNVYAYGCVLTCVST